MSLSTLGLRIESGGVNSNTKGIEYQNKLLLLCMCQHYQNGFLITTEVKEAEPFGDIILQYPSKKNRLIQTKHKETATDFSFESFWDPRKKDFLLKKYFEGFRRIVNCFPDIQEVVICTNNLLPDLVLTDTARSLISFKEILGANCTFGNIGKRYKIDDTCADTITTLEKKIES